jgi:hypothetical protein
MSGYDVLSPDDVVKQPGESILYTFFFRWTDASSVAHGLMNSGETIASVTGVTIQSKTPAGSDDCTIGTAAVNAVEFTEDGKTAAIGECVNVRISAGIDATVYRLQCTVVTTDSNTRIMDGLLKVRD